MEKIFPELLQAVNLTTLLVGVMLGAGGMLALQLVLSYIGRNWKRVLLACAVVSSVAILIISLRGL